MAEGDTIELEGVLEQFEQELTPCIERGDLDTCVKEAAQLAGKMGISADELRGLGVRMGIAGKHKFAYVLALGTADGLDGSEKARAYFNAGLAAQFFGNVDKAETHYLKAIEADKGFALAHYNYANLLVQLNRKYEAEAYYVNAIKADPNYVAAHNDYANLLVQLNRKKEAEDYYVKAIKANPNYALAHYNYANLLRELNRKKESETHYTKAIEADPNYAAAYQNYAILLKELNRKDEAEKQYIKAIEKDHKFATAHYNYAILLGELNRKDEAEYQCIRAIEADPKLAMAHNYYALLLGELNKKAAENQYIKTIEADPYYAMAHYNYAVLLENLNRKDEAENQYIKAIEVDSKLAMARNNYANLLRKRGKFSEAEGEVMQVFKIVQDDSSSQNILPYAHGTLGDILADEDSYEDAEREYQKALEKFDSMDKSSLSEIHNNLGWVYAQMRKHKKAREEFKKARDCDHMNVKTIRNLRALGRIGDEPGVSKIQICLGIVLLIPLIISYYLFFKDMLSETLFTAQSIILICLLIFVVLYHQLAKVKIGNIEFEMSAEHRYLESKSQPQEAISMMER